jgi:plastocyanin
MVRWFVASDNGRVDSTGLVTAGYTGPLRITAVVSAPGDEDRRVFGEALLYVRPLAATRVDVSPAPARLVTGTRLTLLGSAYSRHGDRRDDPATFRSSNPRVAAVTAEGRLTAVAAGRATITASAGQATRTLALEVVPGPVGRVTVEPATPAVRTGDVVRFRATVRNTRGATLRDVTVQWALAAGPGTAQIDVDGSFVAELPGTYTITATAGSRSGEALVRVSPRRVTRGIEVVAHLPLTVRAAEVWVHPSGRCAYVSSIADRVYAVDVTTASQPKIVDSMMADARIINDIMTTEDGRYGVFSREGASNRRNGIVIFEATDPCHPRTIAEYTETVTGGVHSAFVYRGHVYLTDDATGSLRVIDIGDPRHPREVARWQTEQTTAGRYVHDVDIKDGLAYLSYWNDGLVILDVGNGIKGGSPTSPKLVTQFKYDLNATYARVEQLWGPGFVRGTHTAWRAGRYVFVGDEVYAAEPYKGLNAGNSLTFGRLHVIDVSDLERPKPVAWYEPTDGGVHNVWVVGDTLYLGNYQGGARVLDVSGELKGDLLRQGREISWILTADSTGVQPHTPFAWGAVVKDGNIFVPDINSGLWILRLEPKAEATP